MKYHDKTTLCLTYEELIPAIMSESNYKKLRFTAKTLVAHGRGGNGNEVLIEYETLPEKYRKAVKEKYGDPYEYIVKQPLADWVIKNKDQAAYDFYSKHELPTGKGLPEDYIEKYTENATWLNGITYYTTDKRALKADYNVSMDAFWKIVCELIAAKRVALPASYKHLNKALKKYKAEGYAFQIEAWRFGNDNSKKVKDQLAEDILMQMIANDHRHDDTVIAASYNVWAAANGREAITPATVGYRRRNRYHEVAVKRDGKSKAIIANSKHIKRARPSEPLLLINSDDNVLDLYFKEQVTSKKGHKVTDHYYRPVVYVVIDAFNDYILGYAVGDSVTIELVKEAYRNAMHHVVELTGKPHLWHQLQSDKWGLDPELKGELATFFKNQGVFFPAEVAQAKYIERFFGTPWHQVLKMFPNYSGHNITAKERISAEGIQARKKDFPTKDKAPAVIEMAINALRHGINPKSGQSRQAEWLEAFHASENTAKKAISAERKLQLFGIRHQRPNKEQSRITVGGLNFQVNNVKYSFDVPAELFPEYNYCKVDIFYDPNDMSHVLVTDGKGLRFIAEKYRLQPGAVADMQAGDGKRFNDLKEEKKQIGNRLMNYVEERDKRIERSKIDAESLLQAGVLTKAINHKAQKAVSGYVPELPPAEESEPFNIYKHM